MLTLRLEKVRDCLIVDTREQKPLWHHTARTTMSVGDYTTCLLQHHFVAERKSPQDLYSTRTKGHSRFRRQILRAQDKGITMVVYVESSREDFVAKNFKGGEDRKFSGVSLDRMITTISTKYELEFVWCNGREHMKELIIKRFKKEEHGCRKKITPKKN